MPIKLSTSSGWPENHRSGSPRGRRGEWVVLRVLPDAPDTLPQGGSSFKGGYESRAGKRSRDLFRSIPRMEEVRPDRLSLFQSRNRKSIAKHGFTNGLARGSVRGSNNNSLQFWWSIAAEPGKAGPFIGEVPNSIRELDARDVVKIGRPSGLPLFALELRAEDARLERKDDNDPNAISTNVRADATEQVRLDPGRAACIADSSSVSHGEQGKPAPTGKRAPPKVKRAQAVKERKVTRDNDMPSPDREREVRGPNGTTPSGIIGPVDLSGGLQPPKVKAPTKQVGQGTLLDPQQRSRRATASSRGS
jgi:hypothetical protein